MSDHRAARDDDLERATVPAALVAGVLASAVAFGIDERRLSAAARLTEAERSDPACRLPLSRYCDLWDAIAEDARADVFAISLGSAVRIAALGVVGYAMQRAPTVRDAYACFSRFSRLVGDRIAPRIVEERDAVVFRRVLPRRFAANRAMCVAGPLTTLPIIRDMAKLAPTHPLTLDVALPCEAPADRGPIEHAFGCAVRFGAGEAVLRLRPEVFDLPVREHDPALFHYLSRHAEDLARHVPDSERVGDRLRVLLLERIGKETPTAAGFARLVGMSERSLHRSLANEETSFGALVEDCRALLARRYLADPMLSIDEVAFLLGYSEASTFQRAFRRWTGASAGAFRRSSRT